MIKARLYAKDYHDRSYSLRTSTVDGWYYAPPAPGASFVFFAAPLEGGDLRVITTSPVQSVNFGEVISFFDTMNSTYKLELIE